MVPEKPLPYADEFSCPDEYVECLLDFATTTDIFQILCGGVHILDFFTHEPGLFYRVLPQEWQTFLLSCEIMAFLNFLLRDDLEGLSNFSQNPPPESLIQYVRDIRRLSLNRSFTARDGKLPVIPRSVAVGMNVKKKHEVTYFADYVDRLCTDINLENKHGLTHLVDFGSGQNYLGRRLASAPYNRHIVAVEGREHNIAGAKELDVLAGLAEREKVMRNKKLWTSIVDSETPEEKLNPKARRRIAKPQESVDGPGGDFTPVKNLNIKYSQEAGKGSVHYVEGTLESGDLSDVVAKIDQDMQDLDENRRELGLMAVSIHSCGNLSHYGIRSLVLNPSIRAVAIVGCCYNLLTEKLGPPTYKTPYMRPSLQAVNGRIMRESDKYDPQGFPMSERISQYNGDGIRLNVTARMMACQAPQNWDKEDSDMFMTRHFYRAVLQRMFLDRGVISNVYYGQKDHHADEAVSPFDMSTQPVIIGSLRKQCYTSLKAYVWGAVTKLMTNAAYSQYANIMKEKMAGITDKEIEEYESKYLPRKQELSVVWSLMAFSACVVESLIVTDRWLFLKEHSDIVRHCWVETVFDYKESPRNLVVVGVKR
jgi:hypothetical protein